MNIGGRRCLDAVVYDVDYAYAVKMNCEFSTLKYEFCRR